MFLLRYKPEPAKMPAQLLHHELKASLYCA